MQPNYRLGFLTYEEAARIVARGAVALLPVGATEAHGPHLPLLTDVVIAEAAALRTASLLAREDLRALVLPAVAYSVTEYASGFAGTIPLAPDAARSYVREVCVGATRAGFRGVVICNVHLEPAHLETLEEAAEEARAKGAHVAVPDVTKRPHVLRLGEEFQSGACHAGQQETSLVMAADPFLVRELVAELPARPLSLSPASREGKRTGQEAGGARTYSGDPASASAAHGNELYDELAAIFAAAAKELFP